ncbi:MAG: AAA family ATPase [Clostridia bacterium]|nr:AAA family ATPase [Clostridia bacterium]
MNQTIGSAFVPESIKNPEKPTMVIMMGIQGSGKSEFTRRYLSENFVHISLDVVKTRTRERSLINECLENKLNFVIDNTNPQRADRARYIPSASANSYRIVGFFMQSILDDCIERNNRREGKAKIPAVAIAGTSNKLEMPRLSEGFDELYFVSNKNDIMEISKWRNDNEF